MPPFFANFTQVKTQNFNMTVLREMAVSVLKQDNAEKLGVQNKRGMALADESYLVLKSSKPYTASYL